MEKYLTEVTHTMPDNSSVFMRVWKPDDPKAVKGVIGLVHGLGEHAGRYQHVAEYFVEQGFAVIAPDLRGHGQSAGLRGDAAYEQLLDQVNHLLEEATKLFPNKPRFLYGHSMGGNVVLGHALQRTANLAGLMVTAPFLKPAAPIPALKLWFGKLIGSMWGKFRLPNGLDRSGLSRNPAVAEAYDNDKHVHDKISARWFFPAYAVGQQAMNNADDIRLPMLLMHGSADRLTNFDASKAMAEKNTKHITFKEWTDFYHELHNEPEKMEVFSYMFEWMKGRIK